MSKAKTNDKLTSKINELAFELKGLSLSAHLAHFNVTGEGFGTLHKLYGDIYESMDGWFDDLGERVRSLGCMVKILPFEIADPTDAECDYVEYVSGAIDHTICCVDECTAEVESDLVTQNMLLELKQELQKFCWMVKASADTDD